MSNGEKVPRDRAAAAGYKVMAAIGPYVRRAEICGSIRRGVELVHDCDIVAVAYHETAAAAAMEALAGMGEKIRAGKKLSSVYVDGVQVDLWLVPDESWGAALMFATGSPALNIRQRQLARRRGLVLSQYGLFHDGHAIAGATEQEVYAALGLAYLEPAERSWD
jgi:DNA polymerase (family 10)